MNLLLYLNENWQEEYGGHLKIRDLRTDEEKMLSVHFNTLIIQQCSDYSLHGYDLTNFPEGTFRTSIATYAFTKHVRELSKKRTTDWFVNKEEGPLKVFWGRHAHKVVKVKQPKQSDNSKDRTQPAEINHLPHKIDMWISGYPDHIGTAKQMHCGTKRPW